MITVTYHYPDNRYTTWFALRGFTTLFMHRLSLLILSGLLFPCQLAAQEYDSWRMGLVANPQYDYCSDVWGYTDENGHDFAVFGVHNGTVILDVSSNPSSPVETGRIRGASSGWRDLKTHGDYLYVTNEGGGGLDIIDLTDPWHPVLAAQYTGIETAHNLYIADGYAYIVGSEKGAGGIRILDLADPIEPVEVGSWEKTNIHDIYVKNDTAYACGIGEGDLHMLDVSDKSDIKTLKVLDYDNYGTHAVWTTEDSKYIITADEKGGGHVKIWDAHDYDNINLVSEYEVGSEKSVHNVFVKGDKLFISYYVFGTRVVDISDPSNPVEVAYFDLYPGSEGLYSGNWGTYPFSSSGLIYSTSSSGDGFFILQYPLYVDFAHEPLTDTEDMDGPYDVTVSVAAVEDNQLVSGSVMAVSGMNDDFTDTTYLTTGEGADEYVGSLPGYGGEGLYTYYFAVEDKESRWSTLPFGAPDSRYSFNTGPDAVLPVIHRWTKLGDQFGRSGSAAVTAAVSDNIGVGEVVVEYSLSSDPTGAVNSVSMTLSEGIWSGTVSWEDVPWRTVVSYRVRVIDASSQQNEEASAFHSFEILNWTAVGSWETEDLSGWDTGDGWGFAGIGSVGRVIHDSPNGKYEDNANNILSKLDPLDIASYSSVYVSFWHLAFLEEDHDFGYFEVSSDGETWDEISSVTGIGVVSDEIIDLSDYINDGQLWLRFRLSSDAENSYGGWYIDDILLMVDTTLAAVAVDEAEDLVPEAFTLEQNYPNPFNAVTTLRFSLPVDANAEIAIFDLLGRKIQTLAHEFHPAGLHEVKWNATDASGNPVPSGVYLSRFSSGDFSIVRKLILLC